MKFVLRTIILMSLVLGAGCAATSETPATTPTSVATVTTAAPGTVVSTTTTALATATTVDRLSEIAAIFEDLEKRRLQAIFDQDEKAFRALYANEQYLNESLILLDVVVFVGDPSDADVAVVDLVASSEQCLTAIIRTDLSNVVVGGGRAEKQQSLELRDGVWGISYVGGDWACAGPHPLS